MQDAALCARARCPGGAVWRGRYPDPCCVCVPGGLCDRACFVRACVLGGLPDMRMYEMGRASADVRESGLCLQVPVQCTTRLVLCTGPSPRGQCVKRPLALCEAAFGLVCNGLRPCPLCATAFGRAPCVRRPSALCVTAFGRARPVCGGLRPPWCCV